MNCIECGSLNRIGAKYCENCGKPSVRTCSHCNGELSLTARFCSNCGQAVDTAASDSRSLPPKAYTPQHLTEKILTTKSSIEGERKLVTALFADIQGSTELLADLDADEARQLLDPVLNRMMEAVHRYEGTVNQVMGDGLMALFGAPLAHEDHAVRACYAALLMQDSVKAYAKEILRIHGVPVRIRIGINSGEVAVRAVGLDLRMDYSAVGRTLHMAARLEQLAPPGGILLSPPTLELSEGYVQVTSRGQVAVKGFAEPVEIFELTGGSTRRSRLEAAAPRGLTHFVGRSAELDQLANAIAHAGAGRGQIVALVGEPGVGKSRLFWEFVRSHRAQGFHTLESSSVSYGTATPFLPVVDLLQSYFQIESGDSPRQIREKVTGRLLALDRALDSSLPALLWLLNVPLDDNPHWHRLDSMQRRQEAIQSVHRLLLRESQVQPLLLVFEDLHWIDQETQAVLDSLAESLAAARILMLVNYRPEYRHDWGGKTYYRQMNIAPLPPESAQELLDGLLGNDGELAALKRLLIERTEGNPFFLEEIVRTMVETDVLTGDRGARRLAKPIENLQLPSTAHAILAARIDRLEPEDKRLLQAAAVIGKEVSFALISGVADLSPDQLRAGLGRLQAAEFLYETRLFPDIAYSFKHALTHEVAYEGLLQNRRVVLHARILEELEKHDADQGGERLDQLCHHAFRGEAWERAATYLRQAGSKAEERGALRDAVSCFEQALSALAELPSSRENSAESIDVRFDLQGVLYPLGSTKRTLEHLQIAEAQAKSLGDQKRLGQVWAHMTYCYYWMGELERAADIGRQAHMFAASEDDLALQVSTNTRLGQVEFAAGNFHNAAEFFEANLTRLESDVTGRTLGLPVLPASFSCDRLAWCQATLGEFSAARKTLEQGIKLAEQSQHPYTIGNLYSSLGWTYMLQGEFSVAISWLERARSLPGGDSIPLLVSLVTWRLGEAYALAGRVDEGLALLQKAADQLKAARHMGYYPRTLAALGAALLEAGLHEEARVAVARALDLSRAQKQTGVEAIALHVLGEIERVGQPQNLAAADEAYRQALAGAEALAMRPLVAHCNFGIGQTCLAAGTYSAAREYLTAASELYRELEMTHWDRLTEAALSELT